MLTHTILALCIAAALLQLQPEAAHAPAPQAGPVPLRYQWREGQSLMYRVTSASELRPGGRPATPPTDKVLRLTVRDVRSDGSARIDVFVEDFGLDRFSPEIREMFEEDLQESASTPIPIIITARGEILPPEPSDVQVGGRFDRQGADDQRGISELPETVRMMGLQGFALLPPEPKSPRDSWPDQERVFVEGMVVDGKGTATLTAIERGGDGHVARVRRSLEARAGIFAGPWNDQLLGEGEGEVLLDLDNGRLQRSVLIWSVPLPEQPDHGAHRLGEGKQAVRVELILELEKIEPADAKSTSEPAGKAP